LFGVSHQARGKIAVAEAMVYHAVGSTTLITRGSLDSLKNTDLSKGIGAPHQETIPSLDSTFKETDNN
jgi:hypothetical protein